MKHLFFLGDLVSLFSREMFSRLDVDWEDAGKSERDVACRPPFMVGRQAAMGSNGVNWGGSQIDQGRKSNKTGKEVKY